MPSEPQMDAKVRLDIALAQVGLEMVGPLGIGLALDYYYEWTPWGTVIGFVVGFVGGFFHLLKLVQHQERLKKKRSGDGK